MAGDISDIDGVDKEYLQAYPIAPEGPRSFMDLLRNAGYDFVQQDTSKPLPGMHKVFYGELTRAGVPLSSINDFPQDTQRLFEEFSDELSDEEKINLINRHVNSEISYVDEYNYDPSSTRTAAETMRIGGGDCDDTAYSKAALLKLAGIDEERTFIVAVKSRYIFDNGKRTPVETHTLTVAENDGDILVLDGLTNDVSRLNERMETVDPIRIIGQEEEFGTGHQAIENVMSVGNLTGEYFMRENDFYSTIEPSVKVGEIPQGGVSEPVR